MKKTESGRTLLETLMVLVIMGLILAMSVGLYSFVVKRWRKQETVKQISELGIRYKARPIRVAGSEQQIEVKKIYPEATRANVNAIRTPDNIDSKVSVYAQSSGNSFVISAESIKTDSCISMLRNGQYEAALGGTTEYSSSGTGEIVSRSEIQKMTDGELRSKFCGNNEVTNLSLVFGNGCPNIIGGGYWYNGECHKCENGQVEDVGGGCCPAGQVKCGYCQGSFVESSWVCPIEMGCRKKVSSCKKETGTCVECTKNAHCQDCGLGYQCSENHCCPAGQKWGGANCTCDDDQELCGTDCCTSVQTCVFHGGTIKTCCGNDGTMTKECSSPNCCKGNLRCVSMSEGTGHCCLADQVYTAGDGKCCPAGNVYMDGEVQKCCSKPVPTGGTCNDGCVGSCAFGGQCYDVGQAVPEGGCGVCKKVGEDYLIQKKEEVLGQCCNTSNWTLNASDTPINDTNNCGQCGSDGTGEVISGVSVPVCKGCDTSTWHWGNDDTNTAGLGTCQTCSSGASVNVANGANKQEDGKCCISGALAYDATLCPEPKCEQAEGMVCTSGSKESDKCCAEGAGTCQEITSGNYYCCTNNGSNLSVCSSNNCCTSGNCSKKDGEARGRCCEAGYTWDGSSCIATCPVRYYTFETKGDGSCDSSRGITTEVPSATDVGRIGGFDCDYKVKLRWLSVDDFACIQGDSMACQEPSEVQRIWHDLYSDCSDKQSGHCFEEVPQHIYTLPAGEYITVYDMNKVNSYNGVCNAGMSIALTLEPFATGETVTGGCAGTWFEQTGSCEFCSSSSKAKLWDANSSTGNAYKICCLDSNKLIDSTENVYFSGWYGTKGKRTEKGCCPINRWEQWTVEGKPECTQEICCPAGTLSTEGGCCPEESVEVDESATTHRRCKVTPQVPSVDLGPGCSCSLIEGNECPAVANQTIPNCCKDGLVCTWQTGDTKGHCCPEGKVWNDSTNSCLPECNLQQGAVCPRTGTPPNCCVSGLSCTWSSMILQDGYSNTSSGSSTQGHCCPTGQFWNDSTNSCTNPCNLEQGAVCSPTGTPPNCCVSGLSCVWTSDNPNQGHCCPEGSLWDGTTCAGSEDVEECCFITVHQCSRGGLTTVLEENWTTEIDEYVDNLKRTPVGGIFSQKRMCTLKVNTTTGSVQYRAKYFIKKNDNGLTVKKYCVGNPQSSVGNTVATAENESYGAWKEAQLGTNSGTAARYFNNSVHQTPCMAGFWGANECSGSGEIIIQTCVQMKAK